MPRIAIAAAATARLLAKEYLWATRNWEVGDETSSEEESEMDMDSDEKGDDEEEAKWMQDDMKELRLLYEWRNRALATRAKLENNEEEEKWTTPPRGMEIHIPWGPD